MLLVTKELALARARSGLTNGDVGRRAGLSRSTVDRVIRRSHGVAVGNLVAILAAVGLDLVLRVYPNERFRLRDAAHLALTERLRVTASTPWQARLEVPAGEFGRSADLVFCGPGEIIHVEIERRAVDIQAQLRSAHVKRKSLAEANRRPVRLVLCVEDTRRNRDAVREHMPLLKSQLPATTRQVLASLRSGRPLGMDGLAWLRVRQGSKR
jgi:transcriptional regulator with XRE-family HTH domain